MVKISLGGLREAAKRLSSQFLMIVLAVGVVAFVGLFIWNSFRIKEMQADFQKKQTEFAAIQERNDRLQEHLDFYNSPGYMLYVEKVAREALGMSKPGETVLLTVPDKNVSGPVAATSTDPAKGKAASELGAVNPVQSAPKKPGWQNWFSLFFN